MYIVNINLDACDGAGECVEVCPVAILSVVDGKSQVTGDMAECLGCESCVAVCPQQAITIQEV
ncbi:MAG: 4Fe-4S dicluster domain-containing protein [Chloroflexi bacterium]|nr:4Fe-4S dicluster domain-containing protein [Chloroflexota bacterium]MCL5107275.1 4Fe-4S dicluster domain-containing protein [Chloroflexota bacterium]MDA8217933.1 4Fe-4S dicluster domain-containing protein [Dehalococcoidales bacterium]